MTAVRYEEAGDNIVVFTIDRPEARNAVNGDVATELEAAIDRFEEDPDAWVGVLTGAGPVFCAGADLKAIASDGGRSLSTKRGGFGGFVTRERTKPVIAALNGHALAGGCELTLACDLVVAAEGINIGVPEVKRSLAAAAGGLFRLPRALGPQRAAELILTGDPMTSEELHAAGMVNKLVPADQVLDEALALARRITVNAPLAVQESRAVMRRAFLEDESTLFAASGEAMRNLSKTEDFKEGPRAFIEKRAPEWKGR